MTSMGTLEVRGVEFEIAVDRSGYFHSNPSDDNSMRDDTLEGLRKKLMAHTKQRQVRVNVPFVVQRGYQGLMRATATGFHAGTGNVLIKLETDTGKWESMQWERFDVLEDLTEEDFETGCKLAQAVIKADQDWRDFQSKHRMTLNQAVRTAIANSDE